MKSVAKLGKWIVYFLSSSVVLLFFFSSSTYAANSYDMSDPSNWNSRFVGGNANDHLPDDAIKVADLDGDGINDYIIGAIGADYGGSHTGSLYIINGTLLGSWDIGQIYDLNDPTKYSLRIDSTVASSYYPWEVNVGDLNNDGKTDLAVNVSMGNAAAGTYLIFNDLLINYTGKGNTRNLTDSSTYSVRYTSGTNGAQGISFCDFNGDNLLDIAAGFTSTDYAATNSGSVYILFNNKFNSLANGTNIDLTNSSNYDLRIDGSGTSDYFGNLIRCFGNVDADNKNDLGVGSSGYGNGNGVVSGSLYIFSGNFITQYKQSNSNISVANPSSYNIRIDGSKSPAYLAKLGFGSGDIDSDGKSDILIGASGEGTNWTGAAYLVCGNNISNKLNTLGNVLETADSISYNSKFIGINTQDNFGDFVLDIADTNNDGYDDMVMGASMADKTGNGEIYVVYGEPSYCSGTGSDFIMSDTANYDIKFLGASGGTLGNVGGASLQDVNLDGSIDYLFASLMTAYGARTQSGSVYTILNFPHNISMNSVGNNQVVCPVDITGSVTSPISTTNILGVQFQIDSNQPNGSWDSCSASDNAFDSKSESFSCSLNNLNAGGHTIYFRAYDSNYSYTPQSNYATLSFSLFNECHPTVSSPQVIQIPGASSAFLNTIIATSIWGSNTGGQEVMAIISPQTFNFDAYLSSMVTDPKSLINLSQSANEITATQSASVASNIVFAGGGEGIILGVKQNGLVLWQVGKIQNIWFMGYPAPNHSPAKIIPELQSKNSIIVLKYDDTYLIPPGFPNTKFVETKLKLAHSFDGKYWTILSSSVVDTINNTVAAVGKVGGYYMIVGRY